MGKLRRKLGRLSGPKVTGQRHTELRCPEAQPNVLPITALLLGRPLLCAACAKENRRTAGWGEAIAGDGLGSCRVSKLAVCTSPTSGMNTGQEVEA